VTGDPGTGKTVLAYSIAYELGLGPVLRWNITSRSTLQDGLYAYDVLDRVNDTALRNAQNQGPDTPAAQKDDLGDYLTLGPLGDALLPRERPRLLLIDELDKSDIDLPNDLLHILETGIYTIPELRRISVGDEPQWVLSADGDRVPIYHGQVHCAAFPVVIMTSNREREFPPAFQRRCIRVGLEKMNDEQLISMASGYFADDPPQEMEALVGVFTRLRDREELRLATDQLLNLLYLRTRHDALTGGDRQSVIDRVLQSLDEA
jgi:MoxR-like ATPase